MVFIGFRCVRGVATARVEGDVGDVVCCPRSSLGKSVRVVEALDIDSPVRFRCEQGLTNDVRIVEIVIGPQRIVRLVVVDITEYAESV